MADKKDARMPATTITKQSTKHCKYTSYLEVWWTINRVNSYNANEAHNKYIKNRLYEFTLIETIALWGDILLCCILCLVHQEEA